MYTSKKIQEVEDKFDKTRAVGLADLEPPTRKMEDLESSAGGWEKWVGGWGDGASISR